MKKSRMILLVAVAALVLLSGTTAFAASYSGEFNNTYTTDDSVYISSYGYVHLNDNDTADRLIGSTWYSGSHFTTTALHDGSPYESYNTTVNTDHYFWWNDDDDGTGRLRFTNDISPYNNYRQRNAGFFY